MSNILKFINQIPSFIDAKEPKQFLREIISAYEDDESGKTHVYDRGTNRFFIIEKQPVNSIRGWFNKRYLLNILYIMDAAHKPELLDTKGKIKLNRMVKKADKRTTTLGVTGTQAKAAVYW